MEQRWWPGNDHITQVKKGEGGHMYWKLVKFHVLEVAKLSDSGYWYLASDYIFQFTDVSSLKFGQISRYCLFFLSLNFLIKVTLT